MNNSGISWTNDTNNPILTKDGTFYCERVSEGCTFCYAEQVARWVAGMRGAKYHPYLPGGERPEMRLNEGMIAGWKHKKKPRRIFVTSVTDLFGDFFPTQWKFQILQEMVDAPMQTFLILTKRELDMMQTINTFCDLNGLKQLPRNIWVGVTVENQKRANERIPLLLKTKCTVRWLSVEPLLGPISFSEFMTFDHCVEESEVPSDFACQGCLATGEGDCQAIMTMGIDWVVVGGESGRDKKVRPMSPQWVYSIREECRRANVPFFFKQWGEWTTVTPDDIGKRSLNVSNRAGVLYYKTGTKENGNLLQGQLVEEFPEWFDPKTNTYK